MGGRLVNADVELLRCLAEDRTHWRQTTSLAHADLVIVHPSYPRATDGQFSQRLFAQMKPGAACNRFPMVPGTADVACDLRDPLLLAMCLRRTAELVASNDPAVAHVARRLPPGVGVDDIALPTFFLSSPPNGTAEAASEMARMLQHERARRKPCAFALRRAGESHVLAVAQSAAAALAYAEEHGEPGEFLLAQRVVTRASVGGVLGRRVGFRAFFLMRSKDPLVVYFNRAASVVRLSGGKGSKDAPLVWPVHSFDRVMREAGNGDRWDAALDKVRQSVPVVLGLHGRFAQRRGSFHIFACDFDIDGDVQPWLTGCDDMPALMGQGASGALAATHKAMVEDAVAIAVYKDRRAPPPASSWELAYSEHEPQKRQ